ncbi:MAG: carboxymuconolactone decarboxylase family protein [Spongiibacteraceae bacterium]
MTGDREKGVALFREIYGDKAADGLVAVMESDRFGVECIRWSTDFNFGSVWTREALERKSRSCAVLGMMIALRQYDEIKYHTKMGMKNGLSKAEIQEILYSSVPYCGIPASNTARAAMEEAFREIEAAK